MNTKRVTPSEAHRKLAMQIANLGSKAYGYDHQRSAQLLADSEARAVEAALHGANADGLILCGCKDHTHRKDLSCCKIRRADGTPLTVAETFSALTAERERVRVLTEALDAVNTVAPRICKAIPEYGYEMRLVSAALAANSEHAKEGSK